MKYSGMTYPCKDILLSEQGVRQRYLWSQGIRQSLRKYSNSVEMSRKRCSFLGKELTSLLMIVELKAW